MPLLPLIATTEPSPDAWVGAAACRWAPTNTFFDGTLIDTAVEVCRSCPVAGVCLDYALAERLTDGVFGGLTGDDRREIAQLRGITWDDPEPPARKLCPCGKRARPSRTKCSGCAQRDYRASRY